jgi:hypothetical protein
VLAGRGDSRPRGLPQSQRGRRPRDQAAIGQLARRAQGALAHLEGLVEVVLVEAIHRQLDLESGGRGRALVRELLPRPREAAVSLLVAPLPVLDRCAQGGQLDPAHGGFGRQPLRRLEQAVSASIELTDGSLRRRKRHPDVDLARGVGARQEPQRRLEPARRRRRRAGR